MTASVLQVELLCWDMDKFGFVSRGRMLAASAFQMLGEIAAFDRLEDVLRWATSGAELSLAERVARCERRMPWGTLWIGGGDLGLAQTVRYREGGSSWRKVGRWSPIHERWVKAGELV